MRKGGFLAMASFWGDLEGCVELGSVRRCTGFCLLESENFVNLDLAYSRNCIAASAGH